jgi:hypothetical protein
MPNPRLCNRFPRRSRLLSIRASQSGRAHAALFESLLLRHHGGPPIHPDSGWRLRVCDSVSTEPEGGLTRCLGITLHWSGAAHTAFPGGDLPGPDPVRQWRPATIFRRRAAAARLMNSRLSITADVMARWLTIEPERGRHAEPVAASKPSAAHSRQNSKALRRSCRVPSRCDRSCDGRCWRTTTADHQACPSVHRHGYGRHAWPTVPGDGRRAPVRRDAGLMVDGGFRHRRRADCQPERNVVVILCHVTLRCFHGRPDKRARPALSVTRRGTGNTGGRQAEWSGQPVDGRAEPASLALKENRRVTGQIATAALRGPRRTTSGRVRPAGPPREKCPAKPSRRREKAGLRRSRNGKKVRRRRDGPAPRKI